MPHVPESLSNQGDRTRVDLTQKVREPLAYDGIFCWHQKYPTAFAPSWFQEDPVPDSKKQQKKDSPAAKSPGPAEVGSLVIDASALQGMLIDLPEGATQGMRREQDGYDDVHEEIVGHQKEWGEKAGVTQAEVSQIVDLTEKVNKIRSYRPAVAKLLEIIDETLASLEDQRHTVIRTIANTVDAKVTNLKGNEKEELLAKYEKTRQYRSANANKGAKTRRSNASSAAASKDGQKPA